MYGKKVGRLLPGIVVAAVLIGGTTACTDTNEFPDPRIGSFYEVNPEEAEVIEAADGTLFGFREWLNDGCSTWCGCEAFSCVATASSQLADRAEISFAPSNIVCHLGDNSDMLDTVWSEGVPGTGIGEFIEIRQMYRGNGEEVFAFTELCIVNGYAKNESKWKENGRVKTFRVYYEGEYLGEMTLLDTRQPQYIDLTPFQLQVANGDEATFQFEIAQVYEGTTYENTCITGMVIDFDGRAGH
ncbi:MAG: NADase-type glycan-binding domain-containing protein [Acetatifactor sp.]